MAVPRAAETKEKAVGSSARREFSNPGMAPPDHFDSEALELTWVVSAESF
jgi:hypothetical protein